MTRWLSLTTAVLSIASAAWAPETAARRLTASPLKIAIPPAHVSAATELADGRVLISDQETPAVWLLDPATGVAKALGSAGAGPNQYVQPGGFYRGAAGTTLLLDRSQARVLVISPAGEFTRAYSIAVRGVTGSSSADRDQQRLDAKDLDYFVDRSAMTRALMTGGKADSVELVRFEAASQKRDVVATLRAPEQKQISAGDGMVMSRSVIGSPADGWGVTPDGRVAVVRAAPYHVEWISSAGAITAGPEIAYDPLPMTDADKKAFEAANAGKGISAGAVGRGSGANASQMPTVFAAVKPPFEAEEVMVSPVAQVWVLRSRAFGVQEVTYDVFDRTGARVDRVELPADSRVIGFGATTIFVREAGALKRYKLR